MAKPKYVKRPGPATALDEALIERLAELIATGHPKEKASVLCGLEKSTLAKWIERGREAIRKDEHTIQAELVYAIDHAEAQYLQYLLTLKHEAITSRAVDYRPIQGLMSRRFPKDYGQPQAPVPGQPGAEGTVFELASPDEAQASLEEKLVRFLKSPAAAPENEAEEEAASDEAGDETKPDGEVP